MVPGPSCQSCRGRWVALGDAEWVPSSCREHPLLLFPPLHPWRSPFCLCPSLTPHLSPCPGWGLQSWPRLGMADLWGQPVGPVSHSPGEGLGGRWLRFMVGTPCPGGSLGARGRLSSGTSKPSALSLQAGNPAGECPFYGWESCCTLGPSSLTEAEAAPSSWPLSGVCRLLEHWSPNMGGAASSSHSCVLSSWGGMQNSQGWGEGVFCGARVSQLWRWARWPGEAEAPAWAIWGQGQERPRQHLSRPPRPAWRLARLLPWVRCPPDSLCESRPALPALPTPALGPGRPPRKAGPGGGQAGLDDRGWGLGDQGWLGAGQSHGGGQGLGQELCAWPAAPRQCPPPRANPCPPLAARCRLGVHELSGGAPSQGA